MSTLHLWCRTLIVALLNPFPYGHWMFWNEPTCRIHVRQTNISTHEVATQYNRLNTLFSEMISENKVFSLIYNVATSCVMILVCKMCQWILQVVSFQNIQYICFREMIFEGFHTYNRRFTMIRVLYNPYSCTAVQGQSWFFSGPKLPRILSHKFSNLFSSIFRTW